ncbi:hypothetical protein NQ317_008756 [Molorchus minor]|uniref:FYVE-type domain-containing protein n=1 Tax=Molorchus minor TaxID=1323400 RepID=A0ABQ9J4U7_9CUCU|nr:hypothetical protein NQ317_008756 [Molorchus minor]
MHRVLFQSNEDKTPCFETPISEFEHIGLLMIVSEVEYKNIPSFVIQVPYLPVPLIAPTVLDPNLSKFLQNTAYHLVPKEPRPLYQFICNTIGPLLFKKECFPELNNLDIYGKAKKKILKLDDQDLESFRKELTLDKYYLEYSEPQDPGPTRSHTDYFKAVRRERLDHRTTETNKLIIRLDRLLRFFGSDRKQQEQELVAWLDGSVVTRCPSCTSAFNITRRQHHCRLCGSIMCNSCSYFLSYETAQTIVTPVTTTRDGREQSSGRESDSLRVCSHCLDMLECRRRVQIEQMMQPIICQLYSHLQKIKFQIQNSVDMYEKMYNSLVSGETTYFLQDLQSLERQ